MVEENFNFGNLKCAKMKDFSIIIAEYLYHPYYDKRKFCIFKLLNSSELRISADFLLQNSITMVEKTFTLTIVEEIFKKFRL